MVLFIFEGNALTGTYKNREIARSVPGYQYKFAITRSPPKPPRVGYCGRAKRRFVDDTLGQIRLTVIHDMFDPVIQSSSSWRNTVYPIEPEDRTGEDIINHECLSRAKYEAWKAFPG